MLALKEEAQRVQGTRSSPLSNVNRLRLIMIFSSAAASLRCVYSLSRSAACASRSGTSGGYTCMFAGAQQHCEHAVFVSPHCTNMAFMSKLRGKGGAGMWGVSKKGKGEKRAARQR